MRKFNIGDMVTNNGRIYVVEGYYRDGMPICYNQAYKGTSIVGRNYLYDNELELLNKKQLGVKNHVEDKPIERVEQLSLFDL